MISPSQPVFEHAQRVQVELLEQPAGKSVAIRLEAYDEGLGWYSSGSVTLPISQLPLLEQAIAAMRSQSVVTQSAECKIIPFPTAEAEAPSDVAVAVN